MAQLAEARRAHAAGDFITGDELREQYPFTGPTTACTNFESPVRHNAS